MRASAAVCGRTQADFEANWAAEVGGDRLAAEDTARVAASAAPGLAAAEYFALFGRNPPE
jgi:hypothetical protein